MDTLEQVRRILGQVLQIGERAEAMTADTPLFGSLPELDSMAVVRLIHSLEQDLGIEIDDDIDVDDFASLGALAHFVDARR
jgi:acyl carrier protein